MARIGFLGLPSPGHLTPLLSLAQEMKRRGHDVKVFNITDVAQQVEQTGLSFQSLAPRMYPPGTLGTYMETLGKLDGIPAMKYTNDNLCRRAEALFTEALPVISSAHLDILVIDQADMSSSTLAELLHIPFVTVTLALMINYEEGVPGWYPEVYSDDPDLPARNRKWYGGFMQIFGPYLDRINQFREKAGLTQVKAFDELWSTLAQISQQPAEFEFPRTQLPDHFHFTGPFSNPYARATVPFPYEWLNGKPLIYLSFGTIQNRYLHLFQTAAEACAELDAQLVISLGGGASPKDLGKVPPNDLVVPFAPQLDLLHRTVMMITHAGMNSALECLAAGVPMVAMPITNDQPAVAARIAWTGTGVIVPLAECRPVRLRQAILEVFANPSYTQAAAKFQRIISERDGLHRAASIIEQVVATHQPVLRKTAIH